MSRMPFVKMGTSASFSEGMGVGSASDVAVGSAVGASKSVGT